MVGRHGRGERDRERESRPPYILLTAEEEKKNCKMNKCRVCASVYEVLDVHVLSSLAPGQGKLLFIVSVASL